MSDTPVSTTPVRTGAHSRAGIAAILAFQVIVVLFGAMMVAANLEPSLFSAEPGRAESVALKLSIYLTLPVAIVGVIFGIAGVMQETRRRKLAVVGLLLCGLHTLICLFVLRG